MTREQWLNKVIDRSRPMFKAVGAPLGDVRAVLAPPHRKMKAVGLCWHSGSVTDNAREIWISSAIEDPLSVADTLVHELIHAALPDGIGHKKPFVVLARKFHLEGKPTATTGGEAFAKTWTPILTKIGPMPGAKFLGARPADGRPKQEVKVQRNVTCPDCGFTAKVFEEQMHMGRLKCPVEGKKLLMRCEMED